MLLAFPIILGTGSLLTGAGVYYATYAIRSQWLGPSDWRGRTDTSAVALTFDDGHRRIPREYLRYWLLIS